MKYRLNRKFIPWLVLQAVEFWYYYIAALGSLFLLHHFSSEIPKLAKELGDLALSGELAQIEISQFFILAASVLIFRTLSRLLFFYPARIQQRDLRLELVERIEKAKPSNYKNYNEGQIFQTLYNDLNRLRAFVGFALLQFGNTIIAAIIFIPKISENNPKFLIAFTPIIISTLLLSTIVILFQSVMKKGMDEYGEVQNFLLETFNAKKTIQNYHSERDFFNQFKDLSKTEMRTFFKSSVGRILAVPLIRMGIGASLLWAAIIVKNNGMEASDLIFFSAFLYLIQEPLAFLSWMGVVASQGYAAWTRVKNLVGDLDNNETEQWLSDLENGPQSASLPLWGKQIDFKIEQKKWNVFIGETGSGKSYLLEKFAELLQRDNPSYSMIHQEPYLYNDTVSGNIYLGAEVTSKKQEQVKKYLKIFGLDILTETMDELVDLELGENGKRVSGGQAKRIALIRSIIADVDYIIWDDPFSSVDLILENEIIKILKSDNNLKNKTFILSSHRLSTVKKCDEVTLISKANRIVETGTVTNSFNRKCEISEFFQKQLV